MILIKSAATVVRHLDEARLKGQSIGFVPTMGALHRGHISLLEAARKGNDLAVCSIFVNPTQFNDPGDFAKYPVTLEKDIELLEANGVDILFLPAVAEIYPVGTGQLPHFDLGYLETILEGHYRPGHFQGVCQVMQRLLSIVDPHDLFMGQKDYQQCMVIKKLIQLMDMPTRLHPCATLREGDGLAMSSRNMRLDAAARQKAVIISQVLRQVCASAKPGDLKTLTAAAEQTLTEYGFKVDYVAIAAAENLELVTAWDGVRPLVALAAAYLGEIRLIDNMLIPVTNSY
jgi:pantoate--beta-alanine ligase